MREFMADSVAMPGTLVDRRRPVRRPFSSLRHASTAPRGRGPAADGGSL